MIASLINPWTISKICARSFEATTEVGFISGDRQLTASVPSGELWGSIKDILVYEEYEFLGSFRCANLRGGLVIDVGAQVGLYTLKTAPFAKRVISFEPSMKNFRYLKKNVERNSLLNVEINQRALWSSTGRVKFTNGGAGFVSDLVGARGDYEVETTTLEEVVANVGRVNLLKIDIEGAEYDVFRLCTESTLRQIERIVAEVHVYAADHPRKLEALILQLRDSGFSIAMQKIPFQNVIGGLTKPWQSALQSCNGKNIFLYRAFLSAVYGSIPIVKRLKGSTDIGTQSLLFAYRS